MLLFSYETEQKGGNSFKLFEFDFVLSIVLTRAC